MQLPTIDMEATGHNIETLRKNKGIPVKALAAMLGLGTPQSVYKWQQGKAMPTLDNILALSTILDTSMDEIIIRKETLS